MHAGATTGSSTGAQPSTAVAPARSSLWGAAPLFAAAALVHLAVVLAVHWATHGEPLFRDAREFDSVSDAMAIAWRSGTQPQAKELARLAGSAMWGYPAVMAVGKVVTGGGWLGAKALLSGVAATGAVAAYGLAVASGRGRRRATAVGLMVGISPSLVLWDAWGLKDGLVSSIVLWCLLVQTRARFTLACVATLLGTYACLYLRPAAALLLAVALLARVRFRRTYLLGTLIFVGAAALFLLSRLTLLYGMVDNLEVEDGTALQFVGGYGSENLLHHPQYVVTFLLGPFPWAFGPETAVPGRWLYLGTLIWIASLALAPSSLRRAWADTTGLGRAGVLASVAYAATYLVTFGGAFYRQRSLLECTLIVLVVLYVPLSPSAALKRIRVWLALVACVAVLHSPALTPTVWSKGLALSALVLGAFLTITWSHLRERARRFGQAHT